MGLLAVGIVLVVLGLALTFSNVLGFTIGLPLVTIGLVLVALGIVVGLVSLFRRPTRGTHRRAF